MFGMTDLWVAMLVLEPVLVFRQKTNYNLYWRCCARGRLCTCIFKLGFKKKLPILFVVDDNNYAVLTKKDDRRDWKAKELAKALNYLF